MHAVNPQPQVFSCTICEISKYTFFEEDLWTEVVSVFHLFILKIQLPCRNTLYQSQQNIFLMGSTPMAHWALSQNVNKIFPLDLKTIYLFQLSQWAKTKTWIMQFNFSLDLHVFLKCHSSTEPTTLGRLRGTCPHPLFTS